MTKSKIITIAIIIILVILGIIRINNQIEVPEESSASEPSDSLICKKAFPTYLQYGNKNYQVYFYEDQFKTYSYSKSDDGTKQFSLSDKNTLNKTTRITVEPNGSCYSDVSESFDPRNATIYNPFACDQDRMVYGFCPIADISMSKLIWTGDKKNLNNQYGRGYGKYLDITEPGTLLSDKTWRLIPIINNAKPISSLVLPVLDSNTETFIYKLEEGETAEGVADKFGLLMTQIYPLNPSLNGEYVLKSCLRVKDKNSSYRIYCIDTEVCQNIGLNTTQPVMRIPFDLGIFTPPKKCEI